MCSIRNVFWIAKFLHGYLILWLVCTHTLTHKSETVWRITPISSGKRRIDAFSHMMLIYSTAITVTKTRYWLTTVEQQLLKKSTCCRLREEQNRTKHNEPIVKCKDCVINQRNWSESSEIIWNMWTSWHAKLMLWTDVHALHSDCYSSRHNWRHSCKILQWHTRQRMFPNI